MGDCSHFTAGLEATLAGISRAASCLHDDWWVIGSAAIALTGVAIEVPEVELLLSERDARTLLAGWARPAIAPDGEDCFRAVRATHTATPIPVAILGGLEVRIDDGWAAVTPNTRERAALPGGDVYLPDAADQLALLLMLRRTGDLVRAEMLMR